MLDSLKQFLSEIHVLWSKVGLNQKIALAVVLAVFAGALFFWGSWNQRSAYGLLYKGLQHKDAGEIVNLLKADEIPYRIEDEGTTILVPAGTVYDLRLKLAGQGLPREEAGWELFDQNRLGTLSDFVQKVNHTRALQAELERTIGRLKQIEWAKVHIVEARESVFVEQAQEARASVVTKTRGGETLSESQIAGITHLISGAVRGLPPGNVTITDHTGRQLSRPGGNDAASLAASQLDYRRSVEEHLSSRATQMLERVLGPGRAAVTVSAEIDFTATESHSITYKDKVQKSTTETTRESSGPNATGEAGVAANIGGGITGVSAPTTSTTREEKVEYLPPVPTSEEKRTIPGGKISRLAAAVFVSAGECKTVKAADGTETRQYAAAPAAKLKDYEEIVKNAIGYTEGRDSVTISDGEFKTATELAPEQIQQIQTENFRTFIVSLVKSGSTALGVLLFLLFARHVLKKAFVPAQPAPAPAPATAPATRTVSTLDTVSAPGAKSRPLLPAKLKEQVVEAAQQNPDQATQYLRTWLYK